MSATERQWWITVCPTSNSPYMCSCDIEGHWDGDVYVNAECPGENAPILVAPATTDDTSREQQS